MKKIVLIIMLLFNNSCKESLKENKQNSFFIKKEFKFPVWINKIINERMEDSAHNLKGLSVVFHDSFDSVRFVVSNVNSIDFIRKYPSSYYFIRNGVVVFVYSGLESYLNDGNTKIPLEIIKLISSRSVKITEPLITQYSRFRLDSMDKKVIIEELNFNKYLPLRFVEIK
ncbi:MAG: hypothetical protein H7331_05865 [Bacteroidia bacterium]|nr:hypothetical protein [Bacteroidia bacterium]